MKRSHRTWEDGFWNNWMIAVVETHHCAWCHQKVLYFVRELRDCEGKMGRSKGEWLGPTQKWARAEPKASCLKEKGGLKCVLFHLHFIAGLFPLLLFHRRKVLKSFKIFYKAIYFYWLLLAWIMKEKEKYGLS